MKSILLSIVLLLALLSFFLIRRMNTANYAEIPEMVDVNGNSFDKSSLNGKVFIISYFQTWCSDCVKEQPELIELQKHFGQDNLEIILITDEPMEKIEQYLQRFPISLKVFHTDKSLKKDLGVKAFPTTYLFGRQGQLLRKTIEGIDWYNDENVKLIEKQFN